MRVASALFRQGYSPEQVTLVEGLIIANVPVASSADFGAAWKSTADKVLGTAGVGRTSD